MVLSGMTVESDDDHRAVISAFNFLSVCSPIKSFIDDDIMHVMSDNAPISGSVHLHNHSHRFSDKLFYTVRHGN